MNEFKAWAAYIELRGSLNVGMRVEHGFGLLAALYANRNTKHGGYKLWDFMDHEDEPPITIAEAMEKWN